MYVFVLIYMARGLSQEPQDLIYSDLSLLYYRFGFLKKISLREPGMAGAKPSTPMLLKTLVAMTFTLSP
jgi:hypothetical protein